ncbi:MAG: ferritin-like domain-containing protein [Bacteriovorax sp.]|nr:ferritin-like domain-containing protein [Bacteriovorax sp.]
MAKKTGSSLEKQIVEILNRLVEREYAGVIRYSHYSLMIFGYNRIPIVKWFRDQSQESLTHAEEIGELITTFGGHPSLKISKLDETYKHSVDEILNESLAHEKEQLKDLYLLLEVSKDKIVLVEEFARGMIVDEETHVSEVVKMLKKS